MICSSCGGVYSIYKQIGKEDRRKIRYWKCRHYDPATKEPCKTPILTEKQLDGMFIQALMRMKTEPTLYQEETKKILTGIIKEKQRMESELNGYWNRCNKDDERMEQLYFQIAAKRYQEIKLADLTHQIEEYLREVNASTQADSIDSSIAINSSVFKIIKRVEVQPDRNLKFELSKENAREKTMARLYELLELQKKVERQFGVDGYNVFVFGSYVTTRYVEGKSDIDIAIYTEDFDLYKGISMYLEGYFAEKGIESDIFYIDLTMEAPVYCAPLRSKIQFTDYYPKKLEEFGERCQHKLDQIKARIAV